MADPWDTDRLDLAAYLDAVGLTREPPSLRALGDLHAAHVGTFPFENLDVLLGTHPGVGLAQVQEKFVGRGRGGYCFEHATLFAAVLDRLGYDVRRQLGRAGDPETSPRTHLVCLVDLEGRRWLCDPGYGMSLRRPVELADGAEHTDLPEDGEGWRYRVRRTAAGWALERWRGSGWELMHTTDDLAVRPIDVVMGHHHTSTFPGSHFTTGLLLTRHLPGRHVTVTHETVTVRNPGLPTEHHPLAPGELRHLLAELEVRLTSDEVDRVVARFER